jgi:PKD repeat protein
MVQAGETVHLDGSGSTDNIGVAMASWDFDSSDGFQQDAIGLIASHVYGVEGTYFVTLNVTDEAGNSAVDTLEVDVTEVSTQPTATFQVVMSEEEIVRKQASSIRVSATVTVLVDGVPLSDAIVSGDWSGDLHQTMIGTTSSDGEVVFVTRWVKNADTLTLTLTGVQKNGVNYVLAGETSFGI